MRRLPNEDGDRSADPAGVQRYLVKAFRADLHQVRLAMLGVAA